MSFGSAPCCLISVYAVYSRNSPKMTKTNANAEITAAPMAMKIARITSAPMTPQSSTFCWWRLGTANCPRITAKMNRLSTERLFSTR